MQGGSVMSAPGSMLRTRSDLNLTGRDDLLALDELLQADRAASVLAPVHAPVESDDRSRAVARAFAADLCPDVLGENEAWIGEIRRVEQGDHALLTRRHFLV